VGDFQSLMAVVGAHPVITILVLFIVFFSIFFVLIYGLLRFLENRKSGDRVSERELRSQTGIPTYAQRKACPQCGTSMPGVAMYCPECGAPQIPA
jgi:hypothetical protein